MLLSEQNAVFTLGESTSVIIFIQLHEGMSEGPELSVPQPVRLNTSVFRVMGLWVEKVVTNLENRYLHLCFLLHVPLLLLYTCLQGSQIAAK